MTDIMPLTILFNETGYTGAGFGLGVAVTVDVPATRLPGSVGEFAWGGAAASPFLSTRKRIWHWCS
jgi:hypothetical protein